MKGRLLIAIVVSILMFAGSASAGQFGAPQPMKNKYGFSLGFGYFASNTQWEPKDNATDAYWKVNQDQMYVQFTGSNEYAEGYFRLGGVNIDAEGKEGADVDFDEDGGVFWTIGGKGFYPIDEHFGIGPFVQFSMYDKFTDAVEGVPVEIEKGAWDLNVGFAFQVGTGPIAVYAGPFFFMGKADVSALDTKTEFEPKSSFGGMGGVRINLTKAVTLEAEGQYTSDFSYGGMVSFNF